MIQKDRRVRGASEETWAKALEAQKVSRKKLIDKKSEMASYISTIPAKIKGMDVESTGEITWNGNYILTVKIGMTVEEIASEIVEAMSYI